MNNKPPYKDSRGHWRTQSLFREFERYEGYDPLFTLKEDDVLDENGLVIYRSLRRIFLQAGEPTGYKIAKEVFHSYEHWKRLSSAEWFQPYLDAWRDELEDALVSKGIAIIKDIAQGDSAQALTAARYLIEKGWSVKRGRPKKVEKADKERDYEADLARMG